MPPCDRFPSFLSLRPNQLENPPLFEERYASHFSILLLLQKFSFRKFDFPFVRPPKSSILFIYAVFAYVGYIENYSWREKSVAFLA